MRIINLPNCITLANLSCGCLAILLILQPQPNLYLACLLVVLGAIFDFFDGFAARLLGVSSPVGKELDSLADVVTFGLVPAFIARSLFLQTELANTYPLLAYLPLVIALFSALRLAKFNVDTRQTHGFIGMPTPANALLWISFPLVMEFQPDSYPFWIAPFITNGWAILVLVLVSSLLLISELPLIALKFKGFSWAGNESKFILIVGSVVLAAIFHFAAMPIILLLYLVLSMTFQSKNK